MTEIENPYVQATVENFRRTPPSLRARLLGMLAQEVNGVEMNQTDSAASYRRIPVSDRSAEFQWLAENSNQFPGKWVALSGNRLLAHSIDYSEVSRMVKSQGVRDAMFMFIESKESEDFIRFLP